MIIYTDLEKLIDVLPIYIKEYLKIHPNRIELIEIIVDLGRKAEARFFNSTEYITDNIISRQDLDYCVKRSGTFNNKNRSGIKQTFHRISCIKNKRGIIVGLTYRIGRCIIGSISIIRDLLIYNKSLLILGKPGIGKTTLIREISRILSDEEEKRVVIIDTANEIAGDSDIPHLGIGRARRLQIVNSENQHQVMKEAVENHMPEVILVDEIGTELEVLAARTIAEKGVQFIGTAHGNSLQNLIKNPILSELIGGIESVILSDDEVRKTGRQKVVLERKMLPTFKIAIELNTRNFWTIYETVENYVDLILKGIQPKLEIRVIDNSEKIKIKYISIPFDQICYKNSFKFNFQKKYKKKFTGITNVYSSSIFKNNNKFIELIIYSYYLSNDKIYKACKILNISPVLTKEIENAEVAIASKKYFRANLKLQKLLKQVQCKIWLTNGNNIFQIIKILKFIKGSNFLRNN